MTFSYWRFPTGHLLQAFTTNQSVVMSRLALLHAEGRTALYDVVLDGLIMVSRGRYDKKALLVVTDGMDDSSSPAWIRWWHKHAAREFDLFDRYRRSEHRPPRIVARVCVSGKRRFGAG